MLPLLLLSCPVRALRLSISRTPSVSTRHCTLSPLVLPRVRCPRLLFASFCGPSSLVLPTPGLLPLPLVGLFLLPLLNYLLLFTHYSWACCFLGLFSYRSVFFSLGCGRLVFFLGVFSLSTCGMFSSPLLVVLVGVLWWRQVLSGHRL